MMLAALQPSMTESLTLLWATLHKAAPIAVHDCEVHYLTAMALAADDDRVAHLLLKKLKLARRATDEDGGIVRMNSYVAFRHGGGEERFCQIVHPSAPDMPAYGLAITSLAGAGLIGLSAGQSILWPGEDDCLGELTVVQVENCPGLSKWLEAAM